MTAAALTGLGSGALHAVTGPDHTLSLMPYSSNAKPSRAMQAGLLWGVGHALGTLALSLVLMLSVQHIAFESLMRWGDRIAGLALVTMGLRGALARMAEATPTAVGSSGPLAVGLVHGLTGAAALVLMLPQLVNGSLREQAVYLSGFAVGSTVAMGVFTATLAVMARRRLNAAQRSWVTRGAGWLSVGLGLTWMVSA